MTNFNIHKGEEHVVTMRPEACSYGLVLLDVSCILRTPKLGHLKPQFFCIVASSNFFQSNLPLPWRIWNLLTADKPDTLMADTPNL